MASKLNGVETTVWARGPPPNRSCGETFMRAIYDRDENTFLGRTPKRWAIAITFYLVFYAVLAVMFAVCMGGLFYILDDKKPTYILESSLIGANPGVSSRPQPLDFVVHYSTENTTGHDFYMQDIQDFVKTYANESWFNSKKDCSVEDNFGFPESPCFFIKLNKIYGWKPDFYVKDFPEDMSADLVEYINSLQEIERQQVWVSCWEEHSKNDTKIEYPWGRGLPGRFYPYLNEDGYISPVLPVKFTPPANTLAVIRCRAWAKNIVYNKSLKEPSGYVRILLQIDDDTAVNTTETSKE
ncbi:sodium/potassium-transporting ATPase subunit beta-1-like [Vanessa atalanta]|uniref:sodium/potassium-transporting ATPase subunit beta-1-like n=1 Tax=Vanessa atalanta TaxID=42275 RepID=UPI001FCD16E7|nr:sodium/potassium-transporting ATPase subunit beta-1-like [Vanessa atalanta]